MLPNCCGRAGRGLSATASLEGFHLRKVHDPVEPIHDIVQGARAYARHAGLADPHEGIDYHKVRTHAGLLGELAHHYDSLPADDPSAHKHFDAMRDEVRRQHDFLTKRMGYKVEVTDQDPYKNVHELRADVAKNKRIKVMGTHVTGGHPYFSNEDNDRFRAVHDIFGHLATGRDFDSHGEEAAFQAHSRMFTHHALPAMTSETRGQNGSLIANGRFGDQKIALLPKRLWHPGLARVEAKVDWEEFRLLQHAQDVRSERAGIGGSKEDRDVYFGLGEHGGRGQEHRVNPREWIKHSREPGLEDQPPEFQEHWRGYELGHAHGLTGKVNHEELDREWNRSSHPDHFSEGYQDGLDEALNKHRTVAVLVSGMDDMPKGMQVVAHVSGNSIDVLHCPFCGSGAVIARSDGTIECGYCTSVFTVQVQPAYAGFPQSVDGQPYQWPGMPDPNAVMAPDAPPGTNVNPMAADPMGAGAPPLGDGGLLGVDGGGLPPGAGDSSDPGDGEEGDDEEGDDGGNPFAKGGDDKKSDKKDPKSDDKKSDKKPPTKKESGLFNRSQGEVPAGFSANPLNRSDLFHSMSEMEPGEKRSMFGHRVERAKFQPEWSSGPTYHVGCPRSGPNGETLIHNSPREIAHHLTECVHTSLPVTGLLKTASGAQLDAAEFEAHLAMKYAQNPLVVAQRVREARAKGLL